MVEADKLLDRIDNFILERLGLIVPTEKNKTTYAIHLREVRNSRFDALYHLPHFRSIEKLLDNLRCKKMHL